MANSTETQLCTLYEQNQNTLASRLSRQSYSKTKKESYHKKQVAINKLYGAHAQNNLLPEDIFP